MKSRLFRTFLFCKSLFSNLICPDSCRMPTPSPITRKYEREKRWLAANTYKCLEYKSGISYQCPEDVDGKQGDGESDQTHSLQSALQLQVVLGSPQAQPARDGCQGRDEKKAGHVTQQGALLTPRARVLQPLSNDKYRIGKRKRSIYIQFLFDFLFFYILSDINKGSFFFSLDIVFWKKIQLPRKHWGLFHIRKVK